MRQYLLPESGHFYKANLHCHSTISDGAFTPEQLKKVYMEHGYSILAYTDHEIMLDHSELNEENFLALTSYELEIRNKQEKDWRLEKRCHLNLISKTPHNRYHVCFNEKDVLQPNPRKYLSIVECDDTPYEKEYTPECIRDIVKTANEKGFLVAYNHPAWSMETYEDYSKFGDFYAMEIHNTGCLINDALDEMNIQGYDQMLRSGRRIYALATDDNHNCDDINGPYHGGSFGGWVMIKADELEYGKIIESLEKGQFYSSLGPEIYELYYEDGKVHIKCSDVKKIRLTTNCRCSQKLYAEDGEYVNEAVFELEDIYTYFRLTITDKYGNSAYTNAYFTDELN